MSWSDRFADPIELPNSRQIVTLEDAAVYIQKLPKAQHRLPHWQDAGKHLIKAAEGEPAWLMFAEMFMLQHRPQRDALGQAEAEAEPVTVWIYVNTDKAFATAPFNASSRASTKENIGISPLTASMPPGSRRPQDRGCGSMSPGPT